MKFVDSGILVAGFAPWHDHHEQARAVLAARPYVVAHALVECFSVLTRLPAPMRVSGSVAGGLLSRVDLAGVVSLEASRVAELVTRILPEVGILGGAVYDALIAATVVEHGGTLVTLDRRALSTYMGIGCRVELLE